MPGVVIKDPTTGRIVDTKAQSVEDRYPTGRKNCSRCTRWRHLCDFSFKRRENTPSSICKVCYRQAARKGDKPRHPPSAAERRCQQHEAFQRRITWIKADPERHQEYLETVRLQAYDRRRAAGVPVRKRKLRTGRGPAHEYKDASLFMEWLHWNPRGKAWATLPDNDGTYGRAIRRVEADIKATGSGRLHISIIDDVMTAVGDHDQVSVFYS